MQGQSNMTMLAMVKKMWPKIALAFGMGWFAFTAVNYLSVTETGKGIEITDSKDVTIIVVAATGSDAYPVEQFCEDPLTKVSKAISTHQDQAQGYQLERVRDGKHEAVIWNGETMGATHFWFEGGEQKSEPAIVSDKAKACIERKAGQ